MIDLPLAADSAAAQVKTDALIFAEALFFAARSSGIERPVFELRVVEFAKKQRFGEDGTNAGWFDDPASLAAAAHALDARGARAVYVTLNPTNSALLARAANRIVPKMRSTTSDPDIQRRIWLLVDLDPVRPSGVSATDSENEAALASAHEIYEALHTLGWPDPIAADSGNGAHLLYRVDLPNDSSARELLQHVLEALAARFDNAAVKVDLTVYNAARICKVAGTTARKGDSISDRPHRVSRLLSVPEEIRPVPRELLEALAVGAPHAEAEPTAHSAQPSGNRTDPISPFSVEGFLSTHGLQVASTKRAADGAELWILRVCPFDPAHAGDGGGGGSALIRRSTDGSLGFKCHHNSCSGRDWSALREHLEPGYLSRRAAAAAPVPMPPPPVEPSPIAVEFAKHPRRWATEKPPPRRKLVTTSEGHVILAPGKVGAIASAGGVGKTTATIVLGVSIALGRPWFGLFPIAPEASRRSLFLLGETDAEDAHRAIYDTCDALGLTDEQRALVDENVVILPLAGEPCTLAMADPKSRELAVTRHFDQLIEILEREREYRVILGTPMGGFSIVVIDTLARFGAAEIEVDNATATRFLQTIERLAKCPGEPCILLTAHSSKSARGENEVNIRGASAIADSLRFVLGLVADGTDAVSLFGVKCNFARLLEPTRLVRGENGVLVAEAVSKDEKSAREEAKKESAKQKKVDALRAKEEVRNAAVEQRRTELVPKVVAIVTEHPGITRTELAVLVGGKKTYAEDAITCALAAKYVVFIKAKSQAHHFYLPGCEPKPTESQSSQEGGASFFPPNPLSRELVPPQAAGVPDSEGERESGTGNRESGTTATWATGDYEAELATHDWDWPQRDTYSERALRAAEAREAELRLEAEKDPLKAANFNTYAEKFGRTTVVTAPAQEVQS